MEGKKRRKEKERRTRTGEITGGTEGRREGGKKEGTKEGKKDHLLCNELHQRHMNYGYHQHQHPSQDHIDSLQFASLVKQCKDKITFLSIFASIVNTWSGRNIVKHPLKVSPANDTIQGSMSKFCLFILFV